MQSETKKHTKMRGGIDKDDPFAILLTPPVNETSVQRMAREAEEQRVSDQIDHQIEVEKTLLKKRVLLLGQSESGAFLPSIHPNSMALTHNDEKANPRS